MLHSVAEDTAFETKWDQLMQDISTGKQDIDLADFEKRLGLEPNWDWDDVKWLIAAGRLTMDQLEDMLHAGLRGDDLPRIPVLDIERKRSYLIQSAIATIKQMQVRKGKTLDR